MGGERPLAPGWFLCVPGALASECDGLDVLCNFLLLYLSSEFAAVSAVASSADDLNVLWVVVLCACPVFDVVWCCTVRFHACRVVEWHSAAWQWAVRDAVGLGLGE